MGKVLGWGELSETIGKRLKRVLLSETTSGGVPLSPQAAAVAGLATLGAGMYSHAFGVSPSMSSCSIPAF